MKNTVVRVKEFYNSLLPLSANVKQSITFEMVMDFMPHFEASLGELPMLYTFDESFITSDNYIEVKDGYFTLLPFIKKSNPSVIDRCVFSKELIPFANGVHYSVVRYENEKHFSDQCYVMFDFYQGLSSDEHLKRVMAKIKDLSKGYGELSLVISLNSMSTSRKSMESSFFESIRLLPSNCKIMNGTDFFEKNDFKGRSVYIYTDPMFVMNSPWQNILISRGAKIFTDLPDNGDELVKTIPLYPNVKKEVYKSCKPRKDYDWQTKVKVLAEMVKQPVDYLHVNYLRQLRDIIKSVNSQK